MDRRGFTLLELLVGTALVAVVAVVVAAAFAAGFRIWQRVSQQGDEESVTGMELLSRDLRNTVPSRLAPFTGDEIRLEIPTILVSPSKEGGAVPGVVRYEYNRSARTLDRVLHYFLVPDADQEHRDIVMESVGSVRFSYGDRGLDGRDPVQWTSAWSGRTNEPAAVRVELEFESGGVRFERVRTILLPCH